MDELTCQTARGSYTRGFKQDGGKCVIRQTAGTGGRAVPLEISTANLAHSWGKWKQNSKFTSGQLELQRNLMK